MVGTIILYQFYLKKCPQLPSLRFAILEKTRNIKQQGTAIFFSQSTTQIHKVSDHIGLSHQALLSLVLIFLFVVGLSQLLQNIELIL